MMHDRAGNLGPKTQGQALLRLNGQDQAVGLQVLHRRITEQLKRGAFKLDGNLRRPAGQPFARPQIERARPPSANCRCAI